MDSRKRWDRINTGSCNDVADEMCCTKKTFLSMVIPMHTPSICPRFMFIGPITRRQVYGLFHSLPKPRPIDSVNAIHYFVDFMISPPNLLLSIRFKVELREDPGYGLREKLIGGRTYPLLLLSTTRSLPLETFISCVGEAEITVSGRKDSSTSAGADL